MPTAATMRATVERNMRMTPVKRREQTGVHLMPPPDAGLEVMVMGRGGSWSSMFMGEEAGATEALPCCRIC